MGYLYVICVDNGISDVGEQADKFFFKVTYTVGDFINDDFDTLVIFQDVDVDDSRVIMVCQVSGYNVYYKVVRVVGYEEVEGAQDVIYVFCRKSLQVGVVQGLFIIFKFFGRGKSQGQVDSWRGGSMGLQ